MPPRAKRPCRHRGCTAVTNDVSGFCEIHRQQHAGDGWRNYQPGKTRQERGYGRPWEIKRARIMKRDKYLCQNCRRDGIATKASSVDHIIPKAHGGTDDDFNLESLCWNCHSKKTATERTR
ncbi:HNH endonuclease [Klebsiella variicola]|uniref:HNH endonuclease n=1 Tax=Klebsiella pneumoniae TaxID=573 RepID=UPI000E346030|nr:HNH endonuclease signature motif containing protein [Klebsiella pneumoniae]